MPKILMTPISAVADDATEKLLTVMLDIKFCVLGETTSHKFRVMKKVYATGLFIILLVTIFGCYFGTVNLYT